MTILDQREVTHGNYTNTARIASRLKDVIVNELAARKDRSQPALNYSMLESLDMICSKIARIISGKCDEAEHWGDIAGYAVLAARECSGSHTSNPVGSMAQEEMANDLHDQLEMEFGA